MVNRAAGFGVFQRYDAASAAPSHHLAAARHVAYVVAMEPSTNRDAGRFDARERGELGHLAPGEERRYRLEIGAWTAEDAIEAFARRGRASSRRPRA